MLLSDMIANIIEEMIDDGQGETEVKRNDLAAKIGCVPSQINYVITSRFTPEKGYIIESRRGGGGYIRIVRASMSKNEYLMHFFHAIGDSLNESDMNSYLVNLYDRGLISEREYLISKNSLGNSALEKVSQEMRDYVRADMFRRIILTIMNV